jgi:dienelactone hydrolase
MMTRWMLLCLFAPTSLSAANLVEQGSLTYQALEDQNKLPERYRLDQYKFDWKLEKAFDLPASEISMSRLTFPSSVVSKHAANNTVHAEYYRPNGKGPFPGILILDIIGGDQKLSRGIGTVFAQHGVASLFVQMAYYGPRRGPNDPKLITSDIPHTFAGIRQTILDNRCAAAWLASRPEVDPNRMGILGTSLGSFMSAITAAMEPRLDRVALLVGGGGFVDAYWDHPKAKTALSILSLFGGKEKMKQMIAPVDPITYADRLKTHKLFLIAASRDEVVPPKAAQQLWEATGKPTILWFDTTHVGVAAYLLESMKPIMEHFGATVER